MAPLPWKTLSTREIYKNPWIRVREDVAQLPNGHTTIYGVCETPGCVGVLPFVDAQHVIMVRQFRYVQQEDFRWEMPTGGMKRGEDPLLAAQRELVEEVGHRAGKLTPVSTYYTSKGVFDETAYLYLGEDLSPEAGIPDETEQFEVQVMPFHEVLAMVQRSEIRDSMTVVAVLHAALLRRG